MGSRNMLPKARDEPRMKVSIQFTRNIQPLTALSGHSIVLGRRVISESSVPLLAGCEALNGSSLAIPADLRQLSRQTKRMFSWQNALFRIQRHEIASGSHCMDLHFLATGQQRKRLPSRDTTMPLFPFDANSLEPSRGREPLCLCTPILEKLIEIRVVLGTKSQRQLVNRRRIISIIRSYRLASYIPMTTSSYPWPCRRSKARRVAT